MYNQVEIRLSAMLLESRVLEESHIRRLQRILLDFSHLGVLGMLHFYCSFVG